MDYYPTPIDLCHAICLQIADEYGDFDRIMEPACAEGNFLSAIHETWPNASRVFGFEVSPERANVARGRGFDVRVRNFLETTHTHDQDLVIGNPPFSLAEAFVRKAITHLDHRGLVAFLLPMRFLHGEDRYSDMWPDLWGRLDRVYILPKRPAFTVGGGTSAEDYGVFVFQYERTFKDPKLDFIDNTLINNRSRNPVRGQQHNLDGAIAIPSTRYPR